MYRIQCSDQARERQRQRALTVVVGTSSRPVRSGPSLPAGGAAWGPAGQGSDAGLRRHTHLAHLHTLDLAAMSGCWPFVVTRGASVCAARGVCPAGAALSVPGQLGRTCTVVARQCWRGCSGALSACAVDDQSGRGPASRPSFAGWTAPIRGEEVQLRGADSRARCWSRPRSPVYAVLRPGVVLSCLVSSLQRRCRRCPSRSAEAAGAK